MAVTAAPSPAQPPASFAGLVEKLSPAVVNIRITRVERAAEGPMAMPFGDDEGPFGPLFRRFFREGPRSYRLQGAGSGFIIGPEGYIVTNSHVVEGATEVTVVLADKEEYPARVVGRDPKTDLALLKITPRGRLTPAALGDSDRLQVGDWVVAIGNPFGLSNTVTAGIVSAKGRVIGQGPYDNFIQTDAAINPGNSGGPLFNLQGEVVGINTAIFTRTGGSVGVGFAVPINLARSLLPQLERGKVIRGYLGVQIQDVTPELAAAMNLKGRQGALVASVVEQGPAAQGGVQRGDVITAFNGKPVADATALPPLVATTAPGTTVPVTVLRNGQSRTLTVTIGRQPEESRERGPAGPR
ncbi:MAG: Do family serine endopeptidase [Candidatus Rokubacteria bacterium]|nr:Do family serine endopeptidase [Candidatus Rokubacteria bacterium]